MGEIVMGREQDKLRQAELIKKCLNENNNNDGKNIREKLCEMRVKCKGQDKVLMNMMLSDEN